MIYTENALNVLAAKNYKGIGRAWIIKNLEGNESVNTIVSLLNKDSKEDHPITFEEFERDKTRLQENLKNLDDFTDGLIAIGDSNFPLTGETLKTVSSRFFCSIVAT